MKSHRIQKFFYSVFATSLLFLQACSSQIPPDIRQPLKVEPTIAMVRANADVYLEHPVRWGGVIINIENEKESSWLTIVAYPLSSNGEPQVSRNSLGRFIARFDTFLEPKVYSRDRVITLTGKLVKTETIKIGEFPYNYPVVEAQRHYLWPVEEAVENIYPIWWYDPYYWPYYPPHRH